MKLKTAPGCTKTKKTSVHTLKYKLMMPILHGQEEMDIEDRDNEEAMDLAAELAADDNN